MHRAKPNTLGCSWVGRVSQDSEPRRGAVGHQTDAVVANAVTKRCERFLLWHRGWHAYRHDKPLARVHARESPHLPNEGSRLLSMFDLHRHTRGFYARCMPMLSDVMRAQILVCDDEELVRWSLVEGLREQGYDVVEAENGLECLRRVRASEPALILLDIRMPELDGISALRQLREAGHEVPVIILSALGDVSIAVDATRLGAERYMTKPFRLEDVFEAVDECLCRHRRYARTRAAAIEADRFGLLGGSPAMLRVHEILQKLADIDTPSILLTGESGTGKDLVAQAIHAVGPRSRRPWVEVDSTAIPESLLESTLFGHERGAFTDARTQHRGLFEIADDGVIFLDEIGELPLSMQAKLLRVLENRTFKRVGGTENIQFRAAVVCATNRDLEAEVAANRFREDLYYRINVLPIVLPPLRARTNDIPQLVEHFMEKFNRSFGRTVKRVSPAAMDRLVSWRWPGNVRELRNAIECAMMFNDGDAIDVEHLPPRIRFAADVSAEHNGQLFLLPEEGISLEAVERMLVEQALARCDGNLSAAARLLDLSRYALRNRVVKFGLNQS